MNNLCSLSLRRGLLALALVTSAPALDIPLGGIGGVGDIVPGTGLVRVKAVTGGGPGAQAGLRAGDFIQGAGGVDFSATSTDAGMGFVGAIQDLAMAVDRAEGGTGALALRVIRGGVGGLELNLTLATPGELGPAWPAGSAKAAAIYEWCCAQIHSQVQASSTADFGYNTGWYGMILLAHPNWNSTSGAMPYRNSINKLRTRCESFINGRVVEPAEAYYWNGSEVVANPAYISPGLENWDICSSSIFLALYRAKTGDTSANAVVQRAAEAIAHRIQHWQQYDDPGEPHVFGGGIGRMGHGGVHGDYSHYNGTGALNIINAHALPALALLKIAGANMNTNLGLSINAFGYNPGLVQPTIEEKFRICWDYVKAATTTNGGSDDGNIGYVGTQSGWDSAGRTPGCFAGWHLYGMPPNADDTNKLARQADYFTRRWYRQQHAHAYTLGGVALSQMAMPFLDDRRERFFQENTRLYPALARQPDGSIAYFPGRQNNGGDGYLDYNRVAIINAAMPMAVRSGTLPGLPAPNPARIHAWMRSPAHSWPALAARRAELRGGLAHALDMDITAADGTVLDPAAYTATWTHLSGPAVVAFGTPDAADTTVTVSQAGTYRVNLNIVRGTYTLNEPYDFVFSEAPSGGVAPYVVTQPVSQTVDQGGSVTFTVNAQGTAPLIYQWRRNGVPVGDADTRPGYVIANASAGSAGGYDCVVTNGHGTATSAAATLTVNGVGTFRWGGLWRDVFTGISGNSVANLTGAANYPNNPDASGVLTTAESPVNYADNYGQRWSGWITPPQTGSYRFYIACDDNAELWVSTNDRRANRVRVAGETGWRTSRNWPTSTSDESVSPQLGMVAGQRYYLELLHKEGGGGDNAAITWDWRSPGVWATPPVGSDPLPGAILEYQEGGTLDDQAHPPANYPPIAHGQALVVYGGDFANLTLTGEDFEQQPLSFTVATDPLKGTLSGTAPNLVYAPNPGASGSDSFRFIVNDGALDSEEATVSFSLIPQTAGDRKVWLGTADHLWSAGANWQAGAIPDNNDAVIFNASSTANTATSLNGNRTISRIVVENPPTAISIADSTLTLNGSIEMGPATRDLTLSSAVALAAAQEWHIGAGRTLLVGGAVSGSTALSKSGPGTLHLSAVGTLSGGITVQQGTLELSGGGWYAGHVGGSGMITVNAGATAINRNAHSFGSSNDPNRDLTLNGGRFRLQSETYVDDIWLTAGTMDNIPGAGGDLRARTSGNTVITVYAAAEPSVISCPLTFTGTTTLTVADGPAATDLLVSGPMGNSSAVTKNGSGRMVASATNTHSGAFTVSAGELAVTGSLAAGGTLTIQSAATLSGTGAIQRAVTQHGRLRPGLDGIATLTLASLSQASTAATYLELNGTTAGSGHDQVHIVGAATLAGALHVTLGPGFTPAPGDAFMVLTCATRTGTFSTVNLPVLPADREWVATYDAGSPGLLLSVSPIPPFEQWQTARFGANAANPAIAGPLADPDGDGIKNLLEYALNLDPLAGPPGGAAPGFDGLPGTAATPYGTAFIYRKNLAATDVSFVVEKSADLGRTEPWIAATVTETTLSDDGQTRVVRAEIAHGAIPRLFLRLMVIR